jgi:hypothetical protein
MRSWNRGELEIGMLGGAKLTGRKQFEVRAFRWTRCSLLHLFAADALY